MTLLVAGGANPAKTPLFCRISEIRTSSARAHERTHALFPVTKHKQLKILNLDSKILIGKRQMS